MTNYTNVSNLQADELLKIIVRKAMDITFVRIPLLELNYILNFCGASGLPSQKSGSWGGISWAPMMVIVLKW